MIFPEISHCFPVVDLSARLREDEADYRFGLEGAWLLAPTRHGAHNWEGAILSGETILIILAGNEAHGKLWFMNFNGIQLILIADSNGLKMRFGESFLEHLDMDVSKNRGNFPPNHPFVHRVFPL